MKNENIVRFNSVTEIFNALGIEKPKHPLVGVVDAKIFNSKNKDYLNIKTITNMYCIILKDGDCGMQYGRNQYDFASHTCLVDVFFIASAALRTPGWRHIKEIRLTWRITLVLRMHFL